MSDQPLYRVKDWEALYENAQSKKVKNISWVPMRNTHDGKGYRRVAAHPDACEIMTAFVLILQVASRCATRGLLASSSGVPLDSEDLAFKTGFPQAIFDKAFEVLTATKIGWLEVVKGKHASSTLPAASSTAGQDGATGNRTEGKGREETHTVSPPDPILDSFKAKHPDYERLTAEPGLAAITPDQWHKMCSAYPHADPAKVVDATTTAALMATGGLNDPGLYLKGVFSRMDKESQPKPRRESGLLSDEECDRIKAESELKGLI